MRNTKFLTQKLQILEQITLFHFITLLLRKKIEL